jgi:hypothetical protein
MWSIWMTLRPACQLYVLFISWNVKWEVLLKVATLSGNVQHMLDVGDNIDTCFCLLNRGCQRCLTCAVISINDGVPDVMTDANVAELRGKVLRILMLSETELTGNGVTRDWVQRLYQDLLHFKNTIRFHGTHVNVIKPIFTPLRKVRLSVTRFFRIS